MFITFEGPDGSGKSTAINSLSEFLTNNGIDFILTREPGNPYSKESAAIREILINKDNDMPPMTEALLFAADRRLHLENVIFPALKEGKIVLCDRYIDSSLAYQGAGRELGIDNIKSINEIATDNTWPDLTIFFDIKPEDTKLRVDQRAERDRMELAGDDFSQRVYEGYHKLIKMFPKRFEVVNALKSKEEVFNDVKEIVLNKIKR